MILTVRIYVSPITIEACHEKNTSKRRPLRLLSLKFIVIARPARNPMTHDRSLSCTLKCFNVLIFSCCLVTDGYVSSIIHSRTWRNQLSYCRLRSQPASSNAGQELQDIGHSRISSEFERKSIHVILHSISLHHSPSRVALSFLRSRSMIVQWIATRRIKLPSLRPPHLSLSFPKPTHR